MGSEGLHERYINPYTDFGFKKLFGTDMNKDLLISFLNALLYGEEQIQDITYLNTEHLGSGETDRKAVFDVYCENTNGEKFLVEMQKGEQEYFKDRSIFYSTFPIREQAIKGNGWDYELKAVYTVGILNFKFDNKDDAYFHHEVKLLDTLTKEVFYDKLTFIYLEMPKFNKSEAELETMFDKWLFVLKNLGRLLERPVALQERIFEKLFRAAEIANFTKQELYQYEESLKVYRDWYSVITTAEKKGKAEGLVEGEAKGKAEGLAEGEAKGKAEGLRQVASNLKQKGLSIHEIKELTGLSVGIIESL